jgi:HPt (histidine-containing phosphotransfer) domain-containing protein
MDLQMPRMDGFEAMAEIRRLAPAGGRRLPIVAVTAHAFAEDRARCLAAGMDDYVTKPIRVDALYRAIAAHVAPRTLPAPSPVFRHDELRHRCGDDADLEREVLTEFLETAPRALARLEANVARGEGAHLRSESHRLKGTCQTIGAQTLGAVCARLEELGAQGALAEARALLAQATAELDRLRPLVAGYLRERTGRTERRGLDACTT